jgi:hypothetical protein
LSSSACRSPFHRLREHLQYRCRPFPSHDLAGVSP